MVMTPCVPLKIHPTFRRNIFPLFATFFHTGIFFGIFFDHKVKATYSSETSVDIQRTTHLYNKLRTCNGSVVLKIVLKNI
jgi:hypothetical protein